MGCETPTLTFVVGTFHSFQHITDFTVPAMASKCSASSSTWFTFVFSVSDTSTA